MKKLIINSIALLTLFSVFSCSGQKALTKENAYPQASARIIMNNGDMKEGLIIKKEDNKLLYIDSKSHKKETLNFNDIKSISEADVYYDFNGDVIPVSEIKTNKKSSKMLSYGAGGLLLGAAVGTAVGIGLNGLDVDMNPYITMGLFGAVGAVCFGLKGSHRDFEDAVYETQYKRYQAQEAKKKAELKKQLEEEKKKLEADKKKLEESKKRKEEMMKKSGE